eukprot:218648-Prymnesium_polylepis.1
MTEMLMSDTTPYRTSMHPPAIPFCLLFSSRPLQNAPMGGGAFSGVGGPAGRRAGGPAGRRAGGSAERT